MARDTARTSPAHTCSAHFSTDRVILFLWSLLERQAHLLIISCRGAAEQSPISGFRWCLRRWCKASRRGNTLGRIILDEAVPAVNLHALIGHAYGDFAGKKFRHARFASEAHVLLIREPRCLINEQPRRFHLC